MIANTPQKNHISRFAELFIEITTGNFALQTIGNNGSEHIVTDRGDVGVGRRGAEHHDPFILHPLADCERHPGEDRSDETGNLVGGGKLLDRREAFLGHSFGVFSNEGYFEFSINAAFRVELFNGKNDGVVA